MLRRAVFFSLVFLVTFVLLQPVSAQTEQPHFTTFINQVRGRECCSPGGVNELEMQAATARQLELPMTWVVRYDALTDRDTQPTLKRINGQGGEIGVFLEVTPELAHESGVEYHGTPENWYEAQHAYPVGYSVEDRKKLVDTVMSAYREVFGRWPSTTTAWIIDTPTLEYLKTEYGVTAHQITREQWGTDSYTLDGGMPHEPFFGNDAWAFIPAATPSGKLPLLLRQTIADPLWNYGDSSSSRTSQPNDYRLRDRGFPYFEHLFRQAHDQPAAMATFAILGLENSMSMADQQEWQRQAAAVAQWRKQSTSHQVLTARQLAEWKWAHPQLQLTVTHGEDSINGTERQAWWITTPQYRLRVRAEANQVAITDLRIFSPELTDPYTEKVAVRHAYWVTPFVLAGHRFWENDASFLSLNTDSWFNRPEGKPLPTRITLAENVPAATLRLERDPASAGVELKHGDTVLLRADSDSFSLPHAAKPSASHTSLSRFVHNFIWQSEEKGKKELWGFHQKKTSDGTTWTPFVDAQAFAAAREEQYPFLFPELRARPLSAEKTSLLITNRFAQADRNPVRLALFPRDKGGYPVALTSTPSAQTDDALTRVTIQKPDGSEGMFFIDLLRETPGRVEFTVQAEGFQQTGSVIFAPRCTEVWKECLKHPQWWWWDLRNRMGDKIREWQREQAQNS